MQCLKKCIAFMALLGICSGASLSHNQSLYDNPLATCLTNPCVQVEGVGKIMGSKKDSEVSQKKLRFWSMIQVFLFLIFRWQVETFIHITWFLMENLPEEISDLHHLSQQSQSMTDPTDLTEPTPLIFWIGSTKSALKQGLAWLSLMSKSWLRLLFKATSMKLRKRSYMSKRKVWKLEPWQDPKIACI